MVDQEEARKSAEASVTAEEMKAAVDARLKLVSVSVLVLPGSRSKPGARGVVTASYGQMVQ